MNNMPDNSMGTWRRQSQSSTRGPIRTFMQEACKTEAHVTIVLEMGQMCLTLVGGTKVFIFSVIIGTTVTWDGPATEAVPSEPFQGLDDGANI